MKNTYTVPCTYTSAVQTSFARFCRVIVVISKSWGTDKPAMTLCRYPRKVQWEATCGIAST